MSEPTSQLEQALAHLSAAPEAGIALSAGQVDALVVYLRELEAYNRHTNLVARADPPLVAREHILDSLSLVPVLAELGAGGSHLVDIGSGAGFPGLVLAVALPDLQVCLIESIAKKARFLEQVVAALGLAPRVSVLNCRAEEAARGRRLRGSFGFATARAVGPLDLVCELALPLLKKGGWLLAQKSQAQAPEEQRRAGQALAVLGGELRRTVVAALPPGKDRVVMLIVRDGDCPDRFPRSPAQIKRAPLAR